MRRRALPPTCPTHQTQWKLPTVSMWHAPLFHSAPSACVPFKSNVRPLDCPMLHRNSPVASPPIFIGGGSEGGIGVSLWRFSEKQGGGGVTTSVMRACCVIRQRVWFRGDCCTTYALASCWWCPHPCGGLPIAAQCDQWCLHRVVRIANRCCWFLVCVCVVSGTCGWIVLCTCLACVHRVPCVCVSHGCCCHVCVRVWGVQPSGHTPPIATHCIWLCVVVPLFLLWLLGSQVVTMSPSVWFRRCSIHVPRSVVARARVHAR